MLLFGLSAMNGFCGGLVTWRVWWAVAELPWNAGSEGGGPTDGIGAAEAVVAS